MNWLNIFESGLLPLDDWVQTGVDWMSANWRGFFQAVKVPVEVVLDGIETVLLAVPPTLMLIAIVALAWRVAGWRTGVVSLVAMLLVGFTGMWELTMITLSMVIAAVVFCIVVGVPLGILAARSDRFASGIRPVLDVMQTTPAFVYLVPVVMLFGIGTVAGVLATIVFALPPMVRLTNLGIRQVREDVVEAATAFGASPWQVLTKVQVPLALPTIMAGLNQTIMLSLSMVVIAALIGAGGLGTPVFRGLNSLNVGLAFVGGLGIVLLAIVLDRITQAFGDVDPR
ncbi:MAG: proline/glycine betaine ABC transporter permease [Trueperaceae bacterium]|nr:proline/glycine betaine ABC transporter permease [Trueperaceae bacterium]